MRLVECVPNFSEGRNMAVIDAITDEIKDSDGAHLLDVEERRLRAQDCGRKYWQGEDHGRANSGATSAQAHTLLDPIARHANTIPREFNPGLTPYPKPHPVRRRPPARAAQSGQGARGGGVRLSVVLSDEGLDGLLGAQPMRRTEDQRIENDADWMENVRDDPQRVPRLCRIILVLVVTFAKGR